MMTKLDFVLDTSNSFPFNSSIMPLAIYIVTSRLVVCTTAIQFELQLLYVCPQLLSFIISSILILKHVPTL